MQLLWLTLRLATFALSMMELPPNDVCTWMPKHPDFKCSDNITCRDDWPSESGDYGDEYRARLLQARAPSSPPAPEGHSSEKSMSFPDLFENVTKSPTDLVDEFLERLKWQNYSLLKHKRRDDTDEYEPSPIDVPCCRPTLDCFLLVEDIEDDIVSDERGRYIENLDTWKQVACCIATFWLSCKCPETDVSEMTWAKPPACSNELC
ncbi:hypothetical protein PV04_05038 [Phialophora macrospora]|uniref:Uncharacterized protein n=1 Tax=Phialophora macrospora TaxID=1851006 RepID=A0A0D2FRG5_9EURO|nr:hypothetical protein PV04_05038 [Phialophora macrospora]